MKQRPSKRHLTIWLISAMLIIIISYWGYLYLVKHPSTDDAYVQTDTVNIAAQVTGPAASIEIQDHELVKKNQLLFTIDPAPFQIAVDKAKAELASQNASLAYTEKNYKRIEHLVQIGQETPSSGDQVQAQLDKDKASVAAAESQLAQALLDLKHTQVFAPTSGIVTQFTLRPGNNITANNTLFMIVEQDHFWIDANFKETQVERIKPGQPAKIIVEMFPDHTFHGVVDAVSSASGSVFSLLPPENASGNWVKVTQRFPVKIIITDPDPEFPLRAGASASVTVDTTRRS
ncbi:MAG: HlyD family secretion protein [Gammaproteobacteria bacterium]|nr:HlyD family secretion protein [Gammaproteobacteria bacterium]